VLFSSVLPESQTPVKYRVLRNPYNIPRSCGRAKDRTKWVLILFKSRNGNMNRTHNQTQTDTTTDDIMTILQATVRRCAPFPSCHHSLYKKWEVLQLWRQALPHTAFLAVHVSHSRNVLLRDIDDGPYLLLAPLEWADNRTDKPDLFSVSAGNAFILVCMLLESF
jgi:hypothetical protein